MSSDCMDCGRKVWVESGYFSLEKTKQDLKAEEQQLPPPHSPPSPSTPNNRRAAVKRAFSRKRLDLLNFKKGWLTKQYEDGQWKKHWFVLSDQSLRYHRDSVAEEAADLDGEIDLSTCYDVTEYLVQRNYGFQIHTKEGEFTLSAMTSGIRQNWIQTIMKHVHPTTTSDMTSSLPEEKNKSSSTFDTCPRPNENQEAEPGDLDPEQKRSHARERRQEGRSKTFDWAEFRPIQQALAQERANNMGHPDAREPGYPEMEPGELERESARRQEERHKRFGMVDAVDGTSIEEAALRMEVDRSPGLPIATHLKTQNVNMETEQRWHQVETTPLQEEKQVPIAPLHLSSEDGSDRLSTHELTSLLEKELEQSQKEASDLLEQNWLLQDQLRVALGHEQSAREGYVLQATCERGFAAREEMHQWKIEALQRQHQRELEKLREEKDRLLAEETAATISAIEAMKNAHREEMEHELEKSQRSQISSINSDIEALEELQSVQRELEVLSEQYSQKCLENAHLAQALEAERQALQQCQCEN
ncbi:Myosin phosphatase Rho-interacting protein [Heterocephalus glaber]|uniref:Myosin phosphatase Rho-interacting protein n=1 Tax=Heterocephalus glaber TaxID=10181 RepID=G5C2Y5_HETGA|nr:Myosin phosphatase Rho-interacting protein [Heterocephalus glaber]